MCMLHPHFEYVGADCGIRVSVIFCILFSVSIFVVIIINKTKGLVVKYYSNRSFEGPE